MPPVPRLLVIAGSDSSAGAGLQADLKTAQRFGVYAPTVSLDMTALDVHDFWRPLHRKDALVDGHFSVQCYLDALAGAYQDAARCFRSGGTTIAATTVLPARTSIVRGSRSSHALHHELVQVLQTGQSVSRREAFAFSRN